MVIEKTLCHCALQPISGHFKSFLPFSYYLKPNNERVSFFSQITQITEKMWSVHVGMQITACCLWHHAFTNWAMCCLGAQGQLRNSVVLVWYCVFCLQRRGCDKAHLLLSEVLPGSHTLNTTDSPVCSLSSALIPFIFLTLEMRAGRNESRPSLNKAKLYLNEPNLNLSSLILGVYRLVLVCKNVIKGALQGFRFALPYIFKSYKKQIEKTKVIIRAAKAEISWRLVPRIG